MTHTMPRNFRAREFRVLPVRKSRASYLRPVSSNRWPKFVPAACLPDGGFGDPDVRNPRWVAPRGIDEDKLGAARAQHRLAIEVRLELDRRRMTEGDLEELLGYQRGYLVRKLNGSEPITMRDIVRIGSFEPSIVGALAG